MNEIVTCAFRSKKIMEELIRVKYFKT